MWKKVIAFLFILLLPAALFSQDQAERLSPVDESQAMGYFIKGIDAFESDDFQQALDYLNLAYLSLPDSPGVNYAMADVYFALEDYDNAAYYIGLAIDSESENRWFHLKMADIYIRSRQYDEAVHALNRALEHLPEDRGIRLRLADLYSELREYEKSNGIYNKMLAKKAEFEIHKRKYRNFLAIDMPDSALVELKKMHSLQPDNINTLHTLSQVYLELHDTDSAMDVLLEAKKRNPRNPETLFLLADIYTTEARWDSLGNTFVSMIEDPLFSASQKMELARFLYLKHQSLPSQPTLAEQTGRVLESFSRNEPDYGEAHLLAAEFYLNRNETATAIDKLELANKVMPQEGEAWRQRLQLMFSGGEYEEVVQVGRQASEHVQDDAFIHFFIGASYMFTDRHGQAAEWLEEATLMPSRSSFRSVIYSTLGDVLTGLDRWGEAMEAYETALRLDNSNHNAMNNYAYYMSERQEDLDYAKELALGAIEYEPENAAYLDTVGWIYFKQGDYDNARKYIHASIETGNASAEVFEHMGDVYEKLGRPSDAKKWWEKALEADPDRTHLKKRIDSP